MELLAAAAVAAALVQVDPSSAPEPEQVYRCEVVRGSPGGRHRGTALVGGAGRSLGAWVRWEQEAPDAGRFNIRWTLDPALEVSAAAVEVDVPLRKWKMGQASLALRRPDDVRPADMIPAGPVLHGRPTGGRGVAQISLRTLLAYAADADRVHWHVLSDRSNKVLGSGEIDLTPLRQAVAALPQVRSELSARQARYRSDCRPHVEKPEI